MNELSNKVMDLFNKYGGELLEDEKYVKELQRIINLPEGNKTELLYDFMGLYGVRNISNQVLEDIYFCEESKTTEIQRFVSKMTAVLMGGKDFSRKLHSSYDSHPLSLLFRHQGNKYEEKLRKNVAGKTYLAYGDFEKYVEMWKEHFVKIVENI